MNVTSDPSAPAAAWPPASPAGISPIQHPAWEAARNAILDRAAEGPVTAIVLGDPGTGKTWLLRELASALGGYGFPTMILTQGNLPASLSPGAALLVDDASLMDASTRAELLTQRHGVVVLAGAEWFEDEVDPSASAPLLVRLRTLDPAEIAAFAAQWLQRSGLPDSGLGPGMLARLAASSGGKVGPLVQSLTESARSWQDTPIVALAETPAPKLPVAPLLPPVTPQAPARKRRSLVTPLLAGTAVAALVVLVWATVPSRTTPPASAALPALETASIAAPTLAATAQPPAANPSPAPTPALAPVEAALSTEPAALADAAPPPVIDPPDPTLVATLDDPADAMPDPPTRAGPPGLVLIAQRGDTLESLYGDVYRDRNAPPLATVRAANPGPVRPGAIVVFPEPPGGWQRVQR